MYEFFLKYPASVYNDSEFVLTSNLPLWLMAAALVVFAIGLVFMLGWKRKVLSTGQLASLGVLQFLMFALVLFMLWQPALVTQRLVSGENAVAVMLDTSSSMNITDGTTTRMVQARSLLDGGNLAAISSVYEILPFSFSERAQRLDNFQTLPNPGLASNIGDSVLQALRQASNTSLGAVILISDGADNSGSINQATMNEIVSFGVPVHTVGIGRESMPEDLELAALNLPAKALPGTTLSAAVTIRHDQGGTARLKVYDGDEFISTHEITLNPERSLTTAFIDVEVPEPGQMDLNFSLDPIAGERNLANNSRAQVVDAPDSHYRILYMEGEPRWEYKFMQRALNDDPSVRLSTLLRVTPNKFYRQGIEGPEELADGFPTEREALFRYDALIIGSVELAQFTDEQQELIHDFVSERGGSLMMLAGRNGLGLGGWNESVVHQALPARLAPNDSAFIRQQVPVFVNEMSARSPILQLSDSEAENARLWAGLPAVADYQSIGALRPAARTLLEIEVDGQRQPLLVTQPYGRGQTYILATGGTWRWQMSMPLDDMSHETFWRQLSRAMVASSPLPFELSATTGSDEIKIRARVRDPESEENQGLAVSAVVSNANNEPVTLELLPVPGQVGAYEAAFTPQANGLYNIEAISRIGSDPVRSTRSAVRYNQGQESFDVRQNRPLLEGLARATGGQYWQPDQWDEITEAISYSTAGITEQDVRYLWDAPLIFLLLVLLKSAEWLLRRRWRTI